MIRSDILLTFACSGLVAFSLVGGVATAKGVHDLRGEMPGASSNARKEMTPDDPLWLRDLHRAPVSVVSSESLDAPPGTAQADHIRDVRPVMVGFHPRAVPHHYVLHALHVPEIASSGLHRPAIHEGDGA